MAPKKKEGGAEAAKATPAASAASGAAAAGMTPEAAKEKADALFKKYRTTQDAKLVPQLERVVEAAPTAIAILSLVKVYLLQALALVLKKGRGPPLSLEARLREQDRRERERHEDELEGEVVAILNKALTAAAQGFFAKERSLSCLVFTAQLAGLLRGRGSAAQLEERRPAVERLHKLAETVARLAGEKKSFAALTWLEPAKEKTAPPFWPLESSLNDISRSDQEEVSQHLTALWKVLVMCKAADEQARSLGEGGGLGGLFRGRPSIEPILTESPWEAGCRVQERLVPWPVLPDNERQRLAQKYRRYPSGNAEAMAAAREQQARPKQTRDQANKAQKQEEHKQALVQKSKRAVEELQHKAKAEAEAAAAAHAKRAKLQAERGEAAQEYLGQSVAAAADEGQEAEQAALLAELRMAVPAVRAGLQRQAQAKERSESDLSLSRVALDRVIAGKPVFYALPAELAAKVAAPAFGGVGAQAVASAGAPVAGDDDSKRCIERLQHLLVGRGDAVQALATRAHGDSPCIRLLHKTFPCPEFIDVEHALDLGMETDVPEPYARWALPDGGKPHPDDMQLLARVAREGQAAAVAWLYRRTAEDFKRQPPTTIVGLNFWDSEVDAQGYVGDAAAADGTAEAALGAADCAEGAAQDMAAAGQEELVIVADPQRAMSCYLRDTFGAAVGHSQHLSDRLLSVSVADHLAQLTATPYGNAPDFVGLVTSFTAGHQILLLLEASDQGKRPEGWQWWHYAFIMSEVLTGDTSKDTAAARLAMSQPDREAALAQASTADAFVRWLMPQHRALDAYILAQNAAAERAEAAQAAGEAQQEQPQAGQGEQQQAGQGEQQQAGRAEQQQLEQQQDSAAAADADAPAAEQQAVAQEQQQQERQEEDGSLQYVSDVQFSDQITDWFMHGLTAISLAGARIPPAAAEAAAAASDGSGSGEAAAAWLWEHKQGVAARILCGLRHLHNAGVLLVPMSEAMLEFVAAQAPAAAKAAVRKAAAEAGELEQVHPEQQAPRQDEAEAPQQAEQQGASEAPQPAQQLQEQQAEEQAASADGQAGVASTVSLSTPYILALLPHLPLASLHQLLVFVCLQLAWRFPALHEAQHACLEGQSELFKQYLQVQASKGGGKGGGKGGPGQQLDVSITRAGLQGVLLKEAPTGAPFEPQHFLAKDVAVRDVIAQLAAAVKTATQPSAGAAAAAPDQQPSPTPPLPEQQQQQAPEKGGSSGSAGSDAGGLQAAAGTEAAASSAAGEAGTPASGAEELPHFLRLAADVAAWQPPATLEDQVSQVLGLSDTKSIATWVRAAAEADAAAAAAQPDKACLHAGTARLAVYYACALHEAIRDSQETMLSMPRGVLSPLQQWLQKYNSSMPLPPTADIEAAASNGMAAVHKWLSQAEKALTLLSLWSLAIDNATTETDRRRNGRPLLEAAQRLLLERQQAGDEAGACRAQAAVEHCQQTEANAETNRRTYVGFAIKLARQLSQSEKDLPSRRALAQLLKLNDAMRVLEEAGKAGSAAAKEQRRQQAAEARQKALHAIDALYMLMSEREQLSEDLGVYLRYVLEQLVLKARTQQGMLLSCCQYNAHQQLARDLLLFLLPTHWHDELARQRRSGEEAALLAEEEAEKERRAREEAKERERKEKLRQAENEKREAERRAKEEAERKAAAEREQQRKQRAAASAAGAKAGGGSRKAGGRLGDYRAELDDLEGAEEDEWEELEAEKREREAEMRRQEGYNRLLEEVEADADEGEWTEAAASHTNRRQQQGQQGQQQGRQHARRQGTPTSPRHEAPKVLSVARSALASAPAMPVPKRGSQASAGASWAEQAAVAAAVAASAEAPASAPSSSSASSATTAAVVAVAPPATEAATAAGAVPAGGWSFDEWPQQEAAPPQQDSELDSLLAGMGIPLTEQPPSASPQLAASPAGPPEEEEDEDEDLRRAIEASMDRSQDVVPSQARWAAASGSAGGGSAAGGGGSAEEAVPDGVGFTALRNEAGEYNCFLNVVVQCLWQCIEFRQKLAAWGPELADADPVVAALQSLFKAFKAQQEGEGEEGPSPNGAAGGSPNGKSPGAAGPRSTPASPARPGPPGASGLAPPTPAKAWQAGHKPAWLLQALDSSISGANGGSRLEPVDPAKLRDALATLPGRNFAAGEMHDAAEVLLTIYERVMETERRLMGGAAAEGSSAIEQVFGLKVQEEVHCSACGRASHHSGYTQYFCMAQAAMLCMLGDMAPTMGLRLREAANQEMKSCDTDLGGCGLPNSVNHFLQRAPRVFTLHLCWATHNEDPSNIAATLAAVDETVDLGEVYQGVDRGLHRYALRSMVCYYGQHYQALVLVPEAGGWLMFDDTRVTRVGTWADVRRKCEAGRIQPSVLFYEAA